ncbi:MAG: fumarylacetoacetate hydrolase family protein [Gammaproteobacteria bacterium]|nr:fumarylacetoacetate hydrolase family protein [Gammaproteobacteria bacterium]MCY4323918.1 fumarylacetoacetate hydrolase family protein [Gammaproteobacteria bacterium]
MKLLRYGRDGSERPGLLDRDGNIRCLASHIEDVNGEAIAPAMLEQLAAINLATLPLVETGVRLGPCVGNVGKFLGIGLNYADHAEESGAPIPAEPEVFSKATSAICGPYDNIIQPLDSNKLDWEVELGLVIGKHCSYVDQASALEHVAGYCVVNDVSERGFQLERGSQWDKGKGCDTFGPMGPWLVTRDEIPDPNNLAMWLEVNGQRYQSGNTGSMIFAPAAIVSYLSRFMSLQPGDVITTGTPAGVGMGQNPPVFLKAGDIIELSVEGLGIQRQRVT